MSKALIVLRMLVRTPILLAGVLSFGAIAFLVDLIIMALALFLGSLYWIFRVKDPFEDLPSNCGFILTRTTAEWVWEMYAADIQDLFDIKPQNSLDPKPFWRRALEQHAEKLHTGVRSLL